MALTWWMSRGYFAPSVMTACMSNRPMPRRRAAVATAILIMLNSLRRSGARERNREHEPILNSETIGNVAAERAVLGNDGDEDATVAPRWESEEEIHGVGAVEGLTLNAVERVRVALSPGANYR